MKKYFLLLSFITLISCTNVINKPGVPNVYGNWYYFQNSIIEGGRIYTETFIESNMVYQFDYISDYLIESHPHRVSNDSLFLIRGQESNFNGRIVNLKKNSFKIIFRQNDTVTLYKIKRECTIENQINKECTLLEYQQAFYTRKDSILSFN